MPLQNYAAKGRRRFASAGAGSARGRLRRVRVCSLYLTYLHRVVNCFHTMTDTPRTEAFLESKVHAARVELPPASTVLPLRARSQE